MSPSTAIKWSTPASDVEQQLDTLNAGQKEGHWQLRLRMLVLPQSTSELKELDPAAYEYYFAQIVNDFIATSHLKVSAVLRALPPHSSSIDFWPLLFPTWEQPASLCRAFNENRLAVRRALPTDHALVRTEI
jgi:hypothetical protein